MACAKQPQIRGPSGAGTMDLISQNRKQVQRGVTGSGKAPSGQGLVSWPPLPRCLHSPDDRGQASAACGAQLWAGPTPSGLVDARGRSRGPIPERGPGGPRERAPSGPLLF